MEEAAHIQTEPAPARKVFTESVLIPQIDLKKRVLSIDVMRGFLMVLIMAGHGLILLDDSPASQGFKIVMTRLVNLATPAFTLVSGMLFGYFEITRRDIGAIKRQYFKRGLQLLTVAHLFIAIGLFPLRKGMPFLEAYFSYWYITDTLGLLFISVPFLITKRTPGLRLGIGIALLAFSRLFFILLPAQSNVGLIFKEFLFGVDSTGVHLLSDVYPLIPLSGLFLLGTVVGNRFARSMTEKKASAFIRSSRRLVVPLIGLSFLLIVLWGVAKFHLFGIEGSFIRTLFFPDKLYSLLPFYIALFFLLAIFYIDRLEIRERVGPVDRLFLLFGRTSLFTYVIHYFIVQTLPYFLGWQGALNIPLMVLYMILAIGVTSRLSSFYQTHFLVKKGPLKERPLREANG
jgi:uncharacterized membrane protein